MAVVWGSRLAATRANYDLIDLTQYEPIARRLNGGDCEVYVPRIEVAKKSWLKLGGN